MLFLVYNWRPSVHADCFYHVAQQL